MNRFDWALGPGHGPVLGAANAAGSAWAATMVADLAGTQPVVGLAGGVLIGFGGALTAAMKDAPLRVVAYRLVCWVAAGIWSACTLGWSNPWSLRPVAILTVGASIAALAGLLLALADKRSQPTPAHPAGPVLRRPKPHEQLAEQWQALLRRVTRIKTLEVVGCEVWKNTNGHTLHVKLPADGTTIDQVKQHEKGLATAANLEPGCNVEVLPAEGGRGSILVRVATVNGLADTRHLPSVFHPATVHNDLEIGFASDHSPVHVNLRFHSLVMVGQTEAGKTNQLSVITSQLARCTDVLIWAIDLSGKGKYPRPWIRPWKDRQASRPAIDWAAVTEAEVELMLRAAIQVIDGRTAYYQDLMHQQNVDFVPVSPDLPEIVIVIDEFGKVPEKLHELVKVVADTGRGGGVRLVSCALRATAEYLPRGVIAQSRNRIGLRVSDAHELQYLLDQLWTTRFDAAALPYPGSGIVASDAAGLAHFKGYRMEPRMVAQSATATADLRPELDEPSAALADTVTRPCYLRDGSRGTEQVTGVYSGRWDRMLPLIFPTPGAPAGSTPPATLNPQPEETPAVTAADPAAAMTQLTTTGADLATAMKAAQDLLAGEPAGTDDEPAEDGEASRQQEVDALNRTLELEMAPRDRMRQLVVVAGTAGAAPGTVHQQLRDEGYTTVYQTLLGWMKDDVRDGYLIQPAGARGRYLPGPKLR